MIFQGYTHENFVGNVEMRKQFLIGSSHFSGIIKTPNAYYVDKTLFIKEVLEEVATVLLIPRPRRFGKTLNMDMLAEFAGNPESKSLFDGLLISNYPDIMAKQGTYPTIFLSLKSAKQTTYVETLAYLREVMSETFGKFRYLRNHLELDQQDIFDNILYKRSETSELRQSLRTLMQWLCEHFKKQVVIILDEYDAPIHSAWQYDYYKEMVSFMQGYLGDAFKDNPYLFRGVMTGILRVSRENIFSGLNNVRVYSMLNPKYGEYFGFTEAEVDAICESFDLMPERENVRRWYNGYQVGQVQVYNPWSIVNYATDKIFKAYWVNTSNNLVIQTLIARSSDAVKSKFEQLMQGESVKVLVDEHALLPRIDGTDSDSLWSFLLFSGYLKVLSLEYQGLKATCVVAIPNQEIRYLYEEQLSSFFNSSSFSPEKYTRMLNALIEGDIVSFSHDLQNYLETSMSYFDAGREEPERFYHGFVLGILVALRETHEVKSNRESGRGRYDIMIIPKDHSKIGIVMEFKIANSDQEVDMNTALDEAFLQIENKHYEAELKALGIQKIIKMAAVFYKKKMKIRA